MSSARTGVPRSWPRPGTGAAGRGLLLAAWLVLAGCGSTAPPTEGPDWTVTPPGATVQLSARVTFDGMQVATTNLGDERWAEVAIEIRRDRSHAAFTYKTDTLVEGRTLPMGVMNFENVAVGRRFNPFEGAPREWRVTATLPDGRRGAASGRVEEIQPK